MFPNIQSATSDLTTTYDSDSDTVSDAVGVPAPVSDVVAYLPRLNRPAAAHLRIDPDAVPVPDAVFDVIAAFDAIPVPAPVSDAVTVPAFDVIAAFDAIPVPDADLVAVPVPDAVAHLPRQNRGIGAAAHLHIEPENQGRPYRGRLDVEPEILDFAAQEAVRSSSSAWIPNSSIEQLPEEPTDLSDDTNESTEATASGHTSNEIARLVNDLNRPASSEPTSN